MDDEHSDGDRIELSEGWYLELDGSTRDEGFQAFLNRPDGHETASLDAARNLGHLTGQDETPIPPKVFAEIQSKEYDQYE